MNTRFVTSALQGNLDVVRELSAESSNQDLYDALMYAASRGHLDIVKYLLADSRIDPSSDRFRIVMHKSIDEKQNVIVQYMISNTCVDPSECITTVSMYDNCDLLEWLLADPRVDPTYAHNSSIVNAIFHGNFKTVKRLMEDPRINPATIKWAILRADTADRNYIRDIDNIIEHLLTDHRVLATYNGPSSAKKACKAMSRTLCFKQELLERAFSKKKLMRM